MPTLTFSHRHTLSVLHEELLAAIPALRPREGPSGRLEPVLRVEGEGETVRLTVPEGTDQATLDAIAAVVQAHVPQVVYDPDRRIREVAALRRRERLRGDYHRARARVQAATTLTELREAVIAALDARR